ncbi:MAG: DMT family transporter [Gammaproteobacteria bacterium]|nr:DMT family transporter [Gammaproteobacteria bacterium]
MVATGVAVRERWLGLASAAAVLVIWTSFILISRFSARRALLPFDVVFLRFAFAGLVVLPFAWRRAAQLHAGLGGPLALRRGVLLVLTAGLCYCGCAYGGFYFAPVAHAAVLLTGSLSLTTALVAVLLLGERLPAARLAGLGLILLGGLLVGGHSLLEALAGGSSWKGDLLYLGGSFSWAFYAVLCRRWRVGAIDATLAVALGCLASFVPLYALGVAAGLVPSGLAIAPWREIGLLAVYQGGVVMLLSGLAFTQVVVTFGPVHTTMITAVVLPLAALLAVPLLGEPLGPAALAGLVCVVAGLLVGLRRPPGPARR